MINEKQIKTELAMLIMLGDSRYELGQIQGLMFVLNGFWPSQFDMRALTIEVCDQLGWRYRINEKPGCCLDVDWDDDVDEEYLAKQGVVIIPKW